jgi:membrane protein
MITFFRLLRTTLTEWNEDKAPRLGAALAYYTIFAIAPLLIIAIAIAGLVYGKEAARGQVARETQAALGRPVAEAVQDLIEHTSRSGAGPIATVIGLGTLFFGAAGLFWQLQDALDTVWKVTPKPGRGIWGIIRDRSFSFVMVLGIGLLLLASLVVTTALMAVSQRVSLPELPGGISLWHAVDGIVSVLFLTLLFAMIYKILPDAKIRWADVWTGAGLTALLFTIGRELIGWYLGYAGLASAFGAAGSVVLILFWVYYCAQIFLFGAEFTRVYASYRGSPLEPTSNAVALSFEDRVRQGIPRNEDIARLMRGEGS